MKKLIIFLAVLSVILFTVFGTHTPASSQSNLDRYMIVEKMVHSPYGYDVLYLHTLTGKCYMVRMENGRYIEWKRCGEDGHSWTPIPKENQ
jgi:hypothetical protein